MCDGGVVLVAALLGCVVVVVATLLGMCGCDCGRWLRWKWVVICIFFSMIYYFIVVVILFYCVVYIILLC